jgi:hypothetical protein
VRIEGGKMASNHVAAQQPFHRPKDWETVEIGKSFEKQSERRLIRMSNHNE